MTITTQEVIIKPKNALHWFSADSWTTEARYELKLTQVDVIIIIKGL